MATAIEDLIASDEMKECEPKLSDDLNCPLCLKVFRSPRRLPCLHSFCQDCLQSHISNTASVKGSVIQFCCPLCGNVACSGEISTDKLVHLFPLDTFMLSVLMKSKMKVDLQCNVCQAQNVITPAEDLCIVCEEALCVQCSKVHRSSRLLTTHTILKIEDLPNKQDSILQNNVVFQCTEHAHIPVELYCKSNATQLCAKCFISGHKTCPEVIDFTNETPNLSDAMNQMKEQMQKIEDQFKKFTNINVSNLNKLESEVNDLTIEIRTLKKTINDALDDLEKRVKEESNKIFNEEKKRIEKLNHGCQSHITAIQNSNVVLGSASKYATQSQMFLLTKKIMNQLSVSEQQIKDKCKKICILTLQLEVNPQLKSITSIPRDEIGMLRMKINDEIPIVTDKFKPLKEYKAECVDTREIKGLKGTPWYTKVIITSDKQLLMTDFNNRLLYLLDSSYNIVCSHTFPGESWDMCMVSEDVAAVTLPCEKSVHFLSLKHNSITLAKQIRTRHTCYGISAYSADGLVISGPCVGHQKYYWSLITLDGREKSYHNFDGKGANQTYVALNALKTRLYISVHADNSLHCFGLDGRKYFTFKHQDLKQPQGVAVDREDNVYVVGGGSKNSFQLSSDGFLIQIIINGIDKMPMGICFDQNGDKFVLTHARDTAFSFYRLVDKDG